MNQELLKHLLKETIERMERLTNKAVELIDPHYVTLPEVYSSKEVLTLDGLVITVLSFEEKKECAVILTTKSEAFVLHIYDNFDSLLGNMVWAMLVDVLMPAMADYFIDAYENTNSTDDALEEIINGVIVENSKYNKIDELYQDLQERAPYEEKSERITNIISTTRSVSEALRKLQ